ASGRHDAPIVGAPIAPLARVGDPGVELVPDQDELLRGRSRCGCEVRRELRLPADRGADIVEGYSRMERLDPHLAIVAEPPRGHVGDDDGRVAPQPALL